MPAPLLLVRRPSPNLSSGILTHQTPRATPPTHATSLAQWQAYIDVYRQRGWEIAEVDPADECPDGVFIEDAIIVFGGQGTTPGAVVVPRSGSKERRLEYPTARFAVEKHLVQARGFDVIDFHESGVDPTGEATLDGGDVLKVADKRTVYIGVGARTNAAGFDVVKRELGEKRGWKVVSVSMEGKGWLHLKSATTALPNGSRFLLAATHSPRTDAKTLRITEDIDDGAATPWLEVAEDEGVAIVDLSHGEVLLSSSAPRTKSLLEEQGYKVVTADVADFEALEGCVTCLSVRVR